MLRHCVSLLSGVHGEVEDGGGGRLVRVASHIKTRKKLILFPCDKVYLASRVSKRTWLGGDDDISF